MRVHVAALRPNAPARQAPTAGTLDGESAAGALDALNFGARN